jgi:N-terminal acetyltransferase B complex non-catalytic subunit
MLYLIRSAFAVADRSSGAFYGGVDLPSQPSEEGTALLVQSRQLFRGLADDAGKGKLERGFLLGLLEISRESRRRKWEEGAFLLSGPSKQAA